MHVCTINALRSISRPKLFSTTMHEHDCPILHTSPMSYLFNFPLMVQRPELIGDVVIIKCSPSYIFADAIFFYNETCTSIVFFRVEFP